MRNRPDMSDDQLRDCLRDGWGLTATEITFLPLGFDPDNAAFRVTVADGTLYFIKLRRGTFDSVSIEVPKLLYDRGIKQVIPPIPTEDNSLWYRFETYTVTVSPFVVGDDAVQRPLSEAQMTTLGAALRRVHDTQLPESLRDPIPRESFSATWRDRLRHYLRMAGTGVFDEPLAVETAALLCEQRDVIDELIASAETGADLLRQRPIADVLCHADLHGWNVLVSDDVTFHIIDWDTLTLAPRELDLMFLGSRIGRVWSTPNEVAAFFNGYGAIEIDQVAIRYFREERIIHDMVGDCDFLLTDSADDDDRARALSFFLDNFGPNGLIAYTRRTNPEAQNGTAKYTD